MKKYDISALLPQDPASPTRRSVSVNEVPLAQCENSGSKTRNKGGRAAASLGVFPGPLVRRKKEAAFPPQPWLGASNLTQHFSAQSLFSLGHTGDLKNMRGECTWTLRSRSLDTHGPLGSRIQ